MTVLQKKTSLRLLKRIERITAQQDDYDKEIKRTSPRNMQRLHEEDNEKIMEIEIFIRSDHHHWVIR